MSFQAAIETALSAWFSDSITDPINYKGNAIRGHVEFAESGPDGSPGTVTVKRADVSEPQYRDKIVLDGFSLADESGNPIEDEGGDAMVSEGEVFYAVKGPSGSVIKSGDSASWTIYINKDEGAGWP